MKRIGRVGSKPLADLSFRAALLFCELRRPELHALTLSDGGVLAIEQLADADANAVVGCYTPEKYRVPRWEGLAQQIEQDLNCEINVLRQNSPVNA